jgi:hypothetical protein
LPVAVDSVNSAAVESSPGAKGVGSAVLKSIGPGVGLGAVALDGVSQVEGGKDPALAAVNAGSRGIVSGLAGAVASLAVGPLGGAAFGSGVDSAIGEHVGAFAEKRVTEDGRMAREYGNVMVPQF